MITFSHTKRPLTHFSPSHLLVHYGELALKGRNRDHFEETLVQNMRLALGPGSGATVRRLYGRLIVLLTPEAIWDRVAENLTRVFGIEYLMPAITSEPTLEAMSRAAQEVVRGESEPRTFGVHCKRATKTFPFDSLEVQRVVGAAIQGVTEWPVKLKDPDLPVKVELVNHSAYLGFGRIDGWGGLPTGVAGKVVCLLSGGIDSPVAAHRILRRGATAAYVHFHSHPHTGLESQRKVRELAAMVQPPGRSSRLYGIAFAELQRRIVAQCPEALRVILYRRFMVRAAEAIAHREGALALVTGESLGQVASQTLENLRTIDCVARLPILRPLIGLDKDEIVKEAQRIGTFETSIEPHGDCCSFLMPQNPATRSTPEYLETVEKIFDVDAEVARLVAEATAEEVGAPGSNATI